MADSKQWRPIPDFPDYVASEDGEIKRVRVDARGHRLTGQPLRPAVGSTGYAQVTLCRDTARFNLRVNRIICATFHGPAPTETCHAAHNDGDRLNNRAANLRWVEGVENERDKRRHGTAAIGDRHWSKLRPECRARGTRHGLAKLTEEAVRKIRNDGRKAADLAAELGVNKATIINVRSGRTWGHVA